MSEREYPVPDFPDYFVREDGTIVSYRRYKEGRELKPNPVGLSRKTRARPYFVIRLYLPNSREGKDFSLHRCIASAKYQRWPKPYEEVRHMDGDARNNAMCNLQLGDHLNNIVDDIERGDRQTSVEQLDLAIARLMSIRERLE